MTNPLARLGGARRPDARLLAEHDPALHKLVEQMAELPSQMRQALADEMWRRIPLTVDESTYQPALAAGGVLAVNPQTAGYELITTIVAVVPAGSSGLVQLASTALPVPAGVTTISPMRKLLNTSDTRSLTISGGTGGAALLWLMGEQMPTYGVLAP